ncbi:LppP/LprE family lipoprotein [Corynebacterium anserum]|uniref:Uncharacterized protein n=1 Tax=Corynebacterium anserum TaxID=2684406 RepID=A0A7G7YN05_9CORY|nr:LppP/LprE family lipoprotein [Corynebacterium anserum]MBC2680890.1 hypothetical protein [Corynebacterium anserum]QNH95875.1 hypothetical protein GP473_03560 [Corynebacterium anserum]
MSHKLQRRIIASSLSLVLAAFSTTGCTGENHEDSAHSVSPTADSLASQTSKHSAEPAESLTEKTTQSPSTKPECTTETLATSGLPSGSIPSEHETPYTYKIKENKFDPCADLSFVLLEGVFAAPSDTAAWESPMSTVVFFHQGKVIYDPSPDVYARVTEITPRGNDSFTIKLKAPGPALMSPWEDGGSVTASWIGNGLKVDKSALNPKAQINSQLYL